MDWFTYSPRILICNFTIQNGETRIRLYQTINITISQNVVQNTSYGIFFAADSEHVLVKGNEITNNSLGVGSYGSVIGCVFAENNITGNLWGGLGGEESFWRENSIIGNNITYNEYYGIRLYSYHAAGIGNNIVGNNIANNEGGILRARKTLLLI